MRMTWGFFALAGTVAVVAGCLDPSPAELPPPPSTAERPAPKIDPTIDAMLAAYSELMNNLELLDRGQFGIERIPGDPAILWHQNKQAGVGYFSNHLERTGFLPVQTKLRELRNEAKEKGGSFGDGLLGSGASPDNVSRAVYLDGKPAVPIRFWAGVVTSLSESHEIRSRKAFAKAAQRAYQAVQSNPGRDFQTEVNGGTLFARAIKFESRKCISCHPGKEVGSVAAVAAAFSGRAKPKAIVIRDPGPGSIPGVRLSALGLKELPDSVEVEKPRGREFSTHRLYSYQFDSDLPAQAIVDFYVAQIKRIPDSAYEVKLTGPETTWLQFEWGEKSTGRMMIDSRTKPRQIRLSIRNLN